MFSIPLYKPESLAAKDPPLRFNVSIGVTGSAMGGLIGGPTGLGVGVSGGQSIGFSYGGSFLDSNFFWSATAAGMATGGVFAGVGLSVQGASGAVDPCLTTTTANHIEVNIGAGVDGSISYDGSSDGNAAVGGYARGVPGTRLGVGAGFGGGGGVSTTSTVGGFTLRQILNALGFPAGAPAGCSTSTAPGAHQ